MNRLPHVVVVLALLALGGCGAEKQASKAAGSVRSAVDPVAQAATRSASAGTVAVAIDGAVSAQGQRIPLSGDGAFDLKAGRGAFAFTTSLPGKGALKIDEVLDKRVIYMRSDAFKQALPSGKEWLKIDLQAFGRQHGIDLSGLQQFGAGQDPTQFLRYLEKSGAKPRKVGAETIDGTPTTKYTATIDLQKVAAQNGDARVRSSVDAIRKMTGTTTIPAVVWVDGSGRVRREHVTYTATRPVRVTTDFTMDFTKYGDPVSVKTPDASQTVDALKLRGG